MHDNRIIASKISLIVLAVIDLKDDLPQIRDVIRLVKKHELGQEISG